MKLNLDTSRAAVYRQRADDMEDLARYADLRGHGNAASTAMRLAAELRRLANQEDKFNAKG